MTDKLLALIDGFADLRVLVIGEAMLDSYLDGSTRRLCPEAPVPVVDVTAQRRMPGGAANTADNLCSLGACVQFLSVIGDDAEGMVLGQALANAGVSTEHVLSQPARRTLTKQRVYAGTQLLLRFDEGDTCRIDLERERVLLARLASLFPRSDAVVISD